MLQISDHDRFAGCRFESKSTDADDLVRAQRLAGIDFVKGVNNSKGHGLDGVSQAAYRIEMRRLKGVKTFSFQ